MAWLVNSLPASPPPFLYFYSKSEIIIIIWEIRLNLLRAVFVQLCGLGKCIKWIKEIHVQKPLIDLQQPLQLLPRERAHGCWGLTHAPCTQTPLSDRCLSCRWGPLRQLYNGQHGTRTAYSSMRRSLLLSEGSTRPCPGRLCACPQKGTTDHEQIPCLHPPG